MYKMITDANKVLQWQARNDAFNRKCGQGKLGRKIAENWGQSKYAFETEINSNYLLPYLKEFS